jgi:hypothetical protein
MTVTELKALMCLLCESEDDDITLPTTLIWFTEASDDLAPVARIRVRSEAEWEGGEEFALPSDLVEIRQLTYDDEEILPYNPHVPAGTTTYTRWGDVIVFSEEMDEADVAIAYYRRLTALGDGDDVPEIPTQFHRLYALFGASRYWKFEGDEPVKEQSLRAEYEALKLQLDRHTRRESGPRSFRPTFRW